MLERSSIPTLPAAAGGQQFVIYGDSCSGLPGALHEQTFRQVNAVIRALARAPQFICFPGDEIMGLTSDAAALRRQWQHFSRREMAWLDRGKIPLYHTTGNHTVYDAASEDIFREAMAHLPRNGPADQRGLSYFVRRGELLMVFVNTLWAGTGGGGTVETEWLERVVSQGPNGRWTAVVWREGDGYVALCPAVDVASQGATVAEARDNLAEALTLFFETAGAAEIDRHLSEEVYVTHVDIAVG